MKAYKVLSGVVHVGEGMRIGLSHEQAAVRLHKLTPVEGSEGVYVAAEVLQFRAREIVGFENPADLGKAQLEQIAEASPDDVREALDRVQKAAAGQRAAKEAARARAKAPADKVGTARKTG